MMADFQKGQIKAEEHHENGSRGVPCNARGACTAYETPGDASFWIYLIEDVQCHET
jgi:hypothetical protein